MSGATRKQKSLLSIVLPVYNESEGINLFHYDKLEPALNELVEETYEIIYVNDGSRDNTLTLLTAIADRNKYVKVVNLSRNFGKEIATTAGISVANGDATIIMDSDGQHPPDLIKDFVLQWRQGAQVVIGVRRTNQKEGLLKKWGSKIFYKLFNSTSGSEFIPGSTDFRLIDHVVKVEFLKFTERQRITRGLIDWLGFKRAYISFDAPARIAGQASYTVSQLVKLAMNSFVSLSLTPLFLFGWIGMIITILSFTAGLFIGIEQILLSDPMRLHITGTALLGVFTSFLVGLVLISQGIIALYLSHVHGHSQGRPLFVIDYTSSRGL